MKKDESLIPNGIYCVTGNYKCPYWRLRPNYPEHECGYCDFLEKGDWEINEEHGKIEWQNKDNKVVQITEPHEIPVSLLWDACKECDINMEDEEGENYDINT